MDVLKHTTLYVEHDDHRASIVESFGEEYPHGYSAVFIKERRDSDSACVQIGGKMPKH